MLLFSVLFLSGRGQSGIRLLVTYGILVSFDLFVIPYASGVVLNFYRNVYRGHSYDATLHDFGNLPVFHKRLWVKWYAVFGN